MYGDAGGVERLLIREVVLVAKSYKRVRLERGKDSVHGGTDYRLCRSCEQRSGTNKLAESKAASVD